MSKREVIMAALEHRIRAVHTGTLRRDGRGNDDITMRPADLPAIVLEMRRDSAKSVNEQTDRTIEVDLAIYTTGANRLVDADALLETVMGALLSQGVGLAGVRLREGDTTWETVGEPDMPILRTAVELMVSYRTDYNSIL